MARDVMAELESLGTEQNRKIYRRHGAGDNQFGVSFANLRKLAKGLRPNNGLADELWRTGNQDARVLATLIADSQTMDRCRRSTGGCKNRLLHARRHA